MASPNHMDSRHPLELIGDLSGAVPHVKNPDPTRLGKAACRAEEIGFDNLLMGYISSRAESFLSASNALFHTSRLRLLVAHRPGLMAPPLMARMASTLDMLSGGRLTLNIVAGGSPAEQQREGDFLAHDDRYARAAEYMDVVFDCWTRPEPFDHDGTYYKVRGVAQDVRPLQKPYPTIFAGGASGAGQRFAARYADVYMLWAEPLEQTAQRISEFRQLAAAKGGRSPRISASVRLIIGDTEEQAWAKADATAAPDAVSAGLERKWPDSEDVGRNRLMSAARAALVHDEHLWLGITAMTGGLGATAALVGTPGQVIEALLRYVDIGVSCFQLSGPRGELFDPPPGFLEELKRLARERGPSPADAPASRSPDIRITV